MEPKTKAAALILALTALSFSCLVRSRNLAASPSPPPERQAIGSHKGVFGGRHGMGKKGSSPAVCNSKCNQCKPCMPVRVSVGSMELDLVENIEYYPQVWKCMCHDSVFSP